MGTGSVTLGGAPSSFQSFSTIGNGNTTFYTIIDANGTGWEVGIGTYNSGVLARTIILESSNAGSVITLSTGTHTVFCGYPADKSIYITPTGALSYQIASGDLAPSTQNYILQKASGVGGVGSSSFAGLTGNPTDNFNLSSVLSGFPTKTNNLSDLSNITTARTNLGLGVVSTWNSGQVFYNAPLSGVPTAPTATVGTTNTQIATTSFVTAYVAASGGIGSAVTSVAGRTGAITLTNSDITGLGQAALYNSGTIFYNTPHSGIPFAPTAPNGTNTTQLATTQFVNTAVTLASGGVTSVAGRGGAITLSNVDITGLGFVSTWSSGQVFYNTPLSGIPTAPTAAINTNTTQIATTAFVNNAISGVTGGSGSVTSFNGRIGNVTFTQSDYINIPSYTVMSNSLGISSVPSGINNLILGTPGYTPAAGTMGAQLTTNLPSYYQISLQNTNMSGSTDVVVTANDGNDSIHFGDFGINGSQSGGLPFPNPHAVYLYTTDNELDIGTIGNSGNINFYTNGFLGGNFDYQQYLNLYNGLRITGSGLNNLLDIRVGTGPLLYSMNASGDTTTIGRLTLNGNSVPGSGLINITTPPFNGGTATNNTPHVYFNFGATAPTSWNTAGTIIGGNTVVGFAGNIFDFHNNGGTSVFKVGAAGGISSMGLTLNGAGNVFSSTGYLNVSYSTLVSTSAINFTGNIFTGGTSTTTLPQYLSQPAAATAVSTWNVLGTYIGVNANNNFSGNFTDYHINGGPSLFSVNASGIVSANSFIGNGSGLTGITLPNTSIIGLGNVSTWSSGQVFYNTPLSGVPTAPTAAVNTNTTQLATTAFVTTAISNVSAGSGTSGGVSILPAYSYYGNASGVPFAPSGYYQLILGNAAPFATTLNTVAGQFTSPVNNYYQLSIQNTSGTVNASTDFVATADNGNDSTHYVNFGINSSSGGGAPFTNKNAAYLYTTDNELDISALGSSGIINLYTGPTPSLGMTIDNFQNVTIYNKCTNNGPVVGTPDAITFMSRYY